MTRNGSIYTACVLAVLWVFVVLFGATAVKAAERDEDCLTQAIFQEAGGEKPSGKLAVGNVVMNRWRSGKHGSTICAVVYETSVTTERDGETHIVCQFTFVCSQKPIPSVLSDSLLASGYLAQALIENRIRSDNTDGALYYHRTDNRHPWFDDMIKLGKLVQSARIGQHAFYRLNVSAGSAKVRVGWKF